MMSWDRILLGGSVGSGWGRRGEVDVGMGVFVFFFQAEDGIRDIGVTGVQTCALPICRPVAGELLHRRQLHALGPIFYQLLGGPARRGDASAQLVQVLLRNVDAEGADCGMGLLHRLYSSSCRATGGDQPRWVLRVIYGPLKRIVCYLLPSVLTHGVVRTSRELLVVCNGLDVAVVLDVRLVDRRRHDVVLAPRYEQQRRALFVPEVDVGVLVTRGEVREGPSPHEAARRGDVVALVDLVGLLPTQSIGKAHVELLFGEPNSLVAVCWGLLEPG